jgi:hypothetical protein
MMVAKKDCFSLPNSQGPTPTTLGCLIHVDSGRNMVWNIVKGTDSISPKQRLVAFVFILVAKLPITKKTTFSVFLLALCSTARFAFHFSKNLVFAENFENRQKLLRSFSEEQSANKMETRGKSRERLSAEQSYYDRKDMASQQHFSNNHAPPEQKRRKSPGCVRCNPNLHKKCYNIKFLQNEMNLLKKNNYNYPAIQQDSFYPRTK